MPPKKNVSRTAKPRRTSTAGVFNLSSPSAFVEVGKVEQAKGEAKIIPWGEGDNLPHHYLRLIGASGTATSCLQILETFILANGFTDETAAAEAVNETQTADSLLQDVVGDVASLNGLALRVRLVDGKVYTENLPVECARKLENGEFVFNPTFGQKKVNKEKSEFLPGYTDMEGLKAYAAEFPKEAAETGMLYYYYYKTKGAYVYPIPPYATTGGLADIENDTEISLYDLDEVKSGFRLSAIMTVPGDFESTFDEEGNEIPNPELEGLKATLREFTERKDTTEARKKIMLLTAQTAELAPKLEPFNNSKALQLLDEVTNRAANKVCRHMNVPPVLVGIQTAGQLGQTQEIANMIQLFQMRILKYQSMIQRVMEELYPGKDWTISTLNPLQFVPDYLFQYLTDEQKQTLISRYI